jgi:N-dimethylarginine dimethylaminohydrolase
MGVQRFLLGAPTHYDVEYAINPLTKAGDMVDKRRAAEQHARLTAALDGYGGAAVAPAPAGFPDFVFVSNACLIVGHVAVLARFHMRERRGEEEAVGAWLRERLGLEVVRLPEEEGLYFEGQGDCRWSHGGQRLWIGYGAGRTTLRGAEAVRRLVAPLGIEVVPLRIVDPRTYHLDLCLFPLPNGRALWHSGSFAPAARTALRAAFGAGLTSVPLKFLYGCNGVAVGPRDIVIPRLAAEGYRAWMREKTGLRVHEVCVDEFQKAGGSVSCMVLMVGGNLEHR